jgi:peptide deformylase
MALLPILHYPDERLHTVAAPVQEINDQIRQLVRDMAETMYAAPGVGLAATQVDAQIVESRGTAQCEEGCLSVPGVYETVTRAEWIRVRAQDADGKPFELEADGLLGVCIQHEIDHLRGKVFVEYLSRLKQSRIVAKLRKQQRRAM